jgi:hypothetical protein
MIAMFDIPDALEAEFHAWYNEEHIPEKIGRVPGFLRARRYKALDGRPNYMCIYELEDISVVDNPDYQANYKSGTVNTERMKAKARTFYRNVYVQIADFGDGIPLPADYQHPGAQETA